jgi:hypothetical protein
METKTETRIKKRAHQTLAAGDVLEIRLNGQVVDGFNYTVPEGKVLDAHLSVTGELNNA